MRILVAGGAGAIGRELTPMLVAAGHEVWATSRSAAKAADIEGAGAHPLVMDVYLPETVEAVPLGRSVVDDDDLQPVGRPVGIGEAVEALPEKEPVVPGRDDDADDGKVGRQRGRRERLRRRWRQPVVEEDMRNPDTP